MYLRVSCALVMYLRVSFSALVMYLRVSFGYNYDCVILRPLTDHGP